MDRNILEFPNLKAAIQIYDEKWLKRSDFFVTHIIPLMWRAAEECHVNLPTIEHDDSVSFSREQIYGLLSKAFFLQLPASDKAGSLLGFESLYRIITSVGLNRLLCHLNYFYNYQRLTTEEKRELITFSRHSIQPMDSDVWIGCNTPITSKLFITSQKKMEHSKAFTHLDFANKKIHIHKVIASATQEEILFSTHPELFISMLIFPTLDDNEVVRINGVRRYSSYSGYMGNFRFQGSPKVVLPKEILVLDAMEVRRSQDQYLPRWLNRDLTKLSAGFQLEGGHISTGNWGCGIFGGDVHLKFMLQLIAASYWGKRLDYSTFKESQLRRELIQIHQWTLQKQMTVSQLYELLVTYYDYKESTAFYNFLHKYLS